MNATPRIDSLVEKIKTQYPVFRHGIEESLQADPETFREIGETLLEWAHEFGGEEHIDKMIEHYCAYTHACVTDQLQYEEDGHYARRSYEECVQAVYGNDDVMHSYEWGIYLSNFLWMHNLDICDLYLHRFLPRLPVNASLVEAAPGHGAWGALALHQLPEARLKAFDISTAAISIAKRVAEIAGISDRTEYNLASVLDLEKLPNGTADGAICCFLVEHLEEPEKLVDALCHSLKPHGTAFFLAALTAAQFDHIYEFRNESEVIALCERAGFRVLESRSAGPKRTFPNAKFLSRSMGLILQKRRNEIW